MNVSHRLIALGLFFISLLVIALGYLLSTSETVIEYWCGGAVDASCRQDTLFGIGHPLYLTLYPISILFLFLVAVPREVFVTWVRGICLFMFVGVIVVALSPPMGALFTPSRTEVADLVAKAIVFISLVIIAFAYIRRSSLARKY